MASAGTAGNDGSAGLWAVAAVAAEALAVESDPASEEQPASTRDVVATPIAAVQNARLVSMVLFLLVRSVTAPRALRRR